MSSSSLLSLSSVSCPQSPPSSVPLVPSMMKERNQNERKRVNDETTSLQLEQHHIKRKKSHLVFEFLVQMDFLFVFPFHKYFQFGLIQQIVVDILVG